MNITFETIPSPRAAHAIRSDRSRLDKVTPYATYSSAAHDLPSLVRASPPARATLATDAPVAPFFKARQFADAVFDVARVFLAVMFILATGAAVFAAAFILLFVSL